MIYSLDIEGYRSLKDLSLRLAQLTVIQGENGTGKSNVYQAIRSLFALANGTFAQQIAMEGGTPSCFWAGEQPDHKDRKEIKLELKSANFKWLMRYGLVPTAPPPMGSKPSTMFRTDPDIKQEYLTCESESHNRKDWGTQISHVESMLSAVREMYQYPEMSKVRSEICGWRFYDQVRTDALSPARQSSHRCWSPVLEGDASNLAAAIQTIRESGNNEAFDEALKLAFPEHELLIECGMNTLDFEWRQPGLNRPLKAKELSEGTLKYIALLTALMSPSKPSLMVFNEPENSLNPRLFEPLAKSILAASESTQVIVITHSMELSELLTQQENSRLIELVLENGATRLKEDIGAKRVWRFD